MEHELTPQQQQQADDAADARLATHNRTRRGLWVLAVTLLVAGGAMCYLMATVLAAAGQSEDPGRRDFLTRLAVVCLLTVLGDFILLVWVAWRIIAHRLRPNRHGPTPYINAWALAGKRFRIRKPSDDKDEDDPNRPTGWRNSN